MGDEGKVATTLRIGLKGTPNRRGLLSGLLGGELGRCGAVFLRQLLFGKADEGRVVVP